MNKIIWVIAALVVLIAGGVLLLRNKATGPTTNNATTTTSSDDGVSSNTDIVVQSPKSGSVISSPLSVSGKAKGSWYFEASAPVKVVDQSGKVVGSGHIQAQGEWMTTDFVPFIGTVEFNISTTSASTTSGFVIFENDNPSGDPSRSKSISIPVSFR